MDALVVEICVANGKVGPNELNEGWTQVPR